MTPKTPKILLMILVAGLLVGCGGTILRPKQSQRAQETKEFPAVVLISVPDSHICTGTFIGPRVVLTAAHCTPREAEYTITADFGEFKTTRMIPFGSGSESDPNDISLLVLEERVADFTKGQILPVAPFANKGMRLRLVGFGEEYFESGIGVETKRTGTNTVSRISSWIEFETQLQMVQKPASDRELIVGPENDVGAAAGDSGGPAIFDLNGHPFVVGVSHANQVRAGVLVTEYTNLSGQNLEFLRRMAQERDLEIFFH